MMGSSAISIWPNCHIDFLQDRRSTAFVSWNRMTPASHCGDLPLIALVNIAWQTDRQRGGGEGDWRGQGQDGEVIVEVERRIIFSVLRVVCDLRYSHGMLLAVTNVMFSQKHTDLRSRVAHSAVSSSEDVPVRYERTSACFSVSLVMFHSQISLPRILILWCLVASYGIGYDSVSWCWLLSNSTITQLCLWWLRLRRGYWLGLAVILISEQNTSLNEMEFMKLK